MRRSLEILIGGLLFAALAAFGQTKVPLLVLTNGPLVAPTNFWSANSTGLSSAFLVSRSSGFSASRILALGDSITAASASYVYQLTNRWSFPNLAFFTNGAVSGWRLTNLWNVASNLVNYAPPSGQSGLVFLLIGANDLNSGVDQSSVSNWCNSLELLYATAHSNNWKVCALTTLPCWWQLGASNYQSYYTNRQDTQVYLNRRIFHSTNADWIVDANAVLYDSGNTNWFATDATHPTAYGHQLLSAAVAQALDHSPPWRPSLPMDAHGWARYLNQFENLSNNVALGKYALAGLTTGTNNVAVGDSALGFISTGYAHTAVGHGALANQASGTGNAAFGSCALSSSIDATTTLAIGNDSLHDNISGYGNVSLGDSSLRFITNSIGNTSVGSASLYNSQANYYNSALGKNAGASVVLGFSNTFLGAYSDSTKTDVVRSTAIGAGTSLATNDSIVLGLAGQSVGLGTNLPRAALHVNGAAALSPIASGPPGITNGLCAWWNSNGYPYLRYSISGTTTNCDKLLIP